MRPILTGRSNYLASYKIGETYYVLLEKRLNDDTLAPLTPLSSCVSETLGVRSVHSTGDFRRGRPSDSICVSDNGHAVEPMNLGWSTPLEATRSDENASVGQSHWGEPALSGWKTLPQAAESDDGFPLVAYSNRSAPPQTVPSSEHASVDRWDSQDEPVHPNWDIKFEGDSDDGHGSLSNSEWIEYPQTANSENNAPVSHDDAKEDPESRNEQSAEERGLIPPSLLITNQISSKDSQSGKSDVKDDSSAKTTMAHKGSVYSATSFAPKVARPSDGLKEKIPNFAKGPYHSYARGGSSFVVGHKASSAYTHHPAPYRSYPHNVPHPFAVPDALRFPRPIDNPCWWEPVYPYERYVDGESIYPWQNSHRPRTFNELPSRPGYLPPRPNPIPPAASTAPMAPILPEATNPLLPSIPPADPLPGYDETW